MKNDNPKQSAHWADALADEILAWHNQEKLKRIHVDDMKTPSGRVHTGALRGVVLHDLVSKAVAAKSQTQPTCTYVFNDMDAMDGLPAYLDANKYLPEMGKPFFKIAPPLLEESGVDFSKVTKAEIARFQEAKSFAEFYALDFIDAFRHLGCEQKIIWSSELYQSGRMNEQIRTALDKVELVKKVYREIANYDLPKDWFPFQVICPVCGKIGTTLVTAWDGEQVSFECKSDLVTWAQGCGHQGKISPFNGTGKLLWKVDWPAHWQSMGVTVEGSGKDHTSAGGSRDMANALLRSVFETFVPFDIPYEWILVRGAKMSSSKGVGTSAREFIELFPPEVGRFLFINKHYNSVIDFDPTTMAIPDLFDQYDQAARIYWGEEEGDERLGRSFELSQSKNVPQSYFLARFRDVMTWMQDPKLNLPEKFAQVKGSQLDDQELNELEVRLECAKVWVERYAPQEFKLVATESVPTQIAEFNQEQREFMKSLGELLESQDWQPEQLQQAIFELAKGSIGAKQGFQTIYLSFLGKTSGPKAAWLLLDLDPKERRQRLEAVVKGATG